MIVIPEALAKAYTANLETCSLPPAAFADYQKWLRYYLDFCGKYGHRCGNREGIALFLKKLRDKKQSEAQVTQATHAISLYLQSVTKPLSP